MSLAPFYRAGRARIMLPEQWDRAVRLGRRLQ